MTENQTDSSVLYEDCDFHTKKLRIIISRLRREQHLLRKLRKIYNRQFNSLHESFRNEFTKIENRIVELEGEVRYVKLSMINEAEGE